MLFQGLDLNLLVALDALLTDQSVSVAAPCDLPRMRQVIQWRRCATDPATLWVRDQTGALAAKAQAPDQGRNDERSSDRAGA